MAFKLASAMFPGVVKFKAGPTLFGTQQVHLGVKLSAVALTEPGTLPSLQLALGVQAHHLLCSLQMLPRQLHPAPQASIG